MKLINANKFHRKSGVKLIERRLTPADSPLAITTAMVLAVLAAMLVTSLLFVLYGANPLRAYFALFHEPFATMRGFGYTLVRTAPLTLIALGTIVSWRSGFGYLGFEGCFVIGAAATSWLALATAPGGAVGPLPFVALPAFGALAEFRCRSSVGRRGRPDTSAVWGQRSAHLVDDQLRRHPDRAVPGIGPHARARRSSGDRAAAARYMAAVYPARDTRACRHPARVVGDFAGVDAAAQDARWAMS